MLAAQWFTGWKTWEWIGFFFMWGFGGFVAFCLLSVICFVLIAKASNRFRHWSDRHEDVILVIFVVIAAFAGFFGSHWMSQGEANELADAVTEIKAVTTEHFGPVEFGEVGAIDEGNLDGSTIEVTDGTCSYTLKLKTFEGDTYIQVKNLDNGEDVSLSQDKAVLPTEARAFVDQYCQK